MSCAILAATFTQLHELIDQIEQLKAQNGAQRVAEFLLSLAPIRSGSCTLRLPYDKGLTAARLGMKPDILSRAQAVARRRRPRTQNRAAIADVAALREFTEEDRGTVGSRAE